MRIYQFLPIAALFIAAFAGAAQRVGVPVAPIVFIGALGAFGVALQLEDQKWGDFLAKLFHELHHPGEHRGHHA